MWAWLPDALVQHIATAHARTASGATGVVMRLEKRCHQSATERLAKLAAT